MIPRIRWKDLLPCGHVEKPVHLQRSGQWDYTSEEPQYFKIQEEEGVVKEKEGGGGTSKVTALNGASK